MGRTTRFIRLIAITLAASLWLPGAAALAASVQSPMRLTAADGISEYGITQIARQAGLPTGQPTPSTAVAAAINVVLGFVGALLLLLVVYSGFLWMTAAGSEEKVTKAKKFMANAVIGLAIILAGYGLASFLIAQLKGVATARPPAITTTRCEDAGGSCLNSAAECVTNRGTLTPGAFCSDQKVCCVLPPTRIPPP